MSYIFIFHIIMTEAQYNIGWNTFKDHLQDSTKALFKSQRFTDVTLVSDDMIPIKAHKFILSGASSVLRRLLMMNQDAKPMLYLKGIKCEDLQAILEFIYLGEASILSERLEDFMRSAEDLDIEELCKPKPENQKAGENIISPGAEEGNLSSSKRMIKHEEGTTIIESDKTLTSKQNFKECSENPENLQDVKLKSQLKCEECEVMFSNNFNLERHIQNKHHGIKRKCDKCDRQVSRSNFSRHMRTQHTS